MEYDTLNERKCQKLTVFLKYVLKYKTKHKELNDSVLDNLFQLLKVLSNTKKIYIEDGINKSIGNLFLDVYIIMLTIRWNIEAVWVILLKHFQSA